MESFVFMWAYGIVRPDADASRRLPGASFGNAASCQRDRVESGNETGTGRWKERSPRVVIGGFRMAGTGVRPCDGTAESGLQGRDRNVVPVQALFFLPAGH